MLYADLVISFRVLSSDYRVFFPTSQPQVFGWQKYPTVQCVYSGGFTAPIVSENQYYPTSL